MKRTWCFLLLAGTPGCGDVSTPNEPSTEFASTPAAPSGVRVPSGPYEGKGEIPASTYL